MVFGQLQVSGLIFVDNLGSAPGACITKQVQLGLALFGLPGFTEPNIGRIGYLVSHSRLSPGSFNSGFSNKGVHVKEAELLQATMFKSKAINNCGNYNICIWYRQTNENS